MLIYDLSSAPLTLNLLLYLRQPVNAGTVFQIVLDWRGTDKRMEFSRLVSYLLRFVGIEESVFQRVLDDTCPQTPFQRSEHLNPFKKRSSF